MSYTTQQLWQLVSWRLMQIETEMPVSETDVSSLLETLPLRLPNENYAEWLKRGRKLAKVIPFPKIHFRYLTDVERLAADSRKTPDAPPEKAHLSGNQQFRLTVEELDHGKLKIKVEALGLASGKYARQLIGIAAENNKENLISLIYLDADGEGIDDDLDNTPAVRQALLRPVIALIERDDA